MIAHPIMAWWFALENFTITLGYLFVALAVTPLFMRKIGVRYWWTRIGGIGFFALCGLTHLEMGWGAMSAGGMPGMAGMTAQISTHDLISHGLQALAVWAFVIGLYVELTDVNWRPRQDRTPAARPDLSQ